MNPKRVIHNPNCAIIPPYDPARPKTPGRRRTIMDGLTAVTLILAAVLLTIICIVAYQFDSDQIHKR